MSIVPSVSRKIWSTCITCSATSWGSTPVGSSGPLVEEMAHEFGEFKVVVVGFGPACGWNQMILSYLLGDGVKRKPPRRQQTVEDIYG